MDVGVMCYGLQVIDENVSLLIYALSDKWVWCKVVEPGRDISNLSQMWKYYQIRSACSLVLFVKRPSSRVLYRLIVAS